MDNITDNIMQMLHECHLNKDDFENGSENFNEVKKPKENIEKKKVEEIKNNAEKLLGGTRCNSVGSVEYASLNKILAMCNLEVFKYSLICSK